jgi:hypothetical protein
LRGPNGGLGDVFVKPQSEKGRKQAKAEDAAPANHRSKATSNGDGQSIADGITALHNAHGAGASIGRPGLRHKSGATGPFATHAQANGHAADGESENVGREPAKKCENGKGQDRIDQHTLAAIAVGEETEQKTAEAGGDKQQRGERAGNRFGHAESRKELREKRGIEHHVEAAEKPTEASGEERVALLRRKFTPTKRVLR